MDSRKFCCAFRIYTARLIEIISISWVEFAILTLVGVARMGPTGRDIPFIHGHGFIGESPC